MSQPLWDTQAAPPLRRGLPSAGWGLWDERLSREITRRAGWGQPDFGRPSNLVRRTESRVMRVEVGSNLRNNDLELCVC